MVAMRSGIVIFAHGSSVPSANDAVRTVAVATAKAGGFEAVETAFLEAKPDLEEGVTRLVAQGVDRVLVVPYFLTLGIHLQRDLPGIVTGLASKFQNVEIRIAPPLDGHPGLVRILIERSQEGLSAWK